MNRPYMTRWTQTKVLVIGDLMVDTELQVSAGRPSPEPGVGSTGPGEVVRELRRLRFPGGAANVAMNCRSLGARVDLIGAAASDPDGLWLKLSLQEAGIGTPYAGFAYRGHWEGTTVKTRLTQAQRTLLRVDRDVISELASLETRRWIQEHGPYDALLLSDYDKGALANHRLVSELIQTFRRHHPGGIVTVNPKPAFLVRPVGLFDLVSVNAKEYQAALGSQETVADFARRIPTRMLLKTQGSRGLWLATRDGGLVQQAPLPVPPVDPVGCGDATFAAATLALCVTEDPDEVARIANAAGAAKVQQRGTLPVTPRDLFRLLSFAGSAPLALRGGC